MSKCSDSQNSLGLKSYSWLDISVLEKGDNKNCYYIKEDVDTYIFRLKGDHEAKANKLKQEAKITMQDVKQQPGESDNHYCERIHKELFDTDKRRMNLERNYSQVCQAFQSLLPPLPPYARGIINKNQKKKRKSNKKRKTKKRKSKKRKTKKRKTNKKRNKTKKSKK